MLHDEVRELSTLASDSCILAARVWTTTDSRPEKFASWEITPLSRGENAEDSSKKTRATQRTITCLKLHSKYSKKDRFSGHIIRTAFQNVLWYKMQSYLLQHIPLLVVPKETGTFQHSAASIFNKLPSALRNIKDYNSFCRSLKKYLSNRVK